MNTPTGEKPVLEVLQNAEHYKSLAGDVELAEYFVRVQWLDSRKEDDAINELGLFGNQNTVCKPTTPKWRHTVERLKTFFKQWDSK